MFDSARSELSGLLVPQESDSFTVRLTKWFVQRRLDAGTLSPDKARGLIATAFVGEQLFRRALTAQTLH